MRFTNTIAALAAVMLSSYPHAHADSDKADQSVIADEALPLSPAPPAIVLPNFSPSTVATGFFEQFTSGWDKRWKPSHAKKVDSGDEEWAYVGKWAVEEPTVYPGIVGDKGLVVKKAAAHHAISAKFPKKIDLKGQTLVVQYEVKLQNGLECGGAYLKLLRDQKTLHSEEFSNTTPYVIMFGPDKCGLTNKVHFIFNHKNPVSGKYEEKHLTTPPSMRPVKTTELYTLIVHPNNTYIIKQNNEQVKTGSLLTDFTPAVNPDKEINDPKDEKPADWEDEAQILDEKAKKPDDWDEEAPSQIDDEEATTPDDWLVDEPKSIPDPEAQKPTDWDDDEDGDWVAPTIPNPKCLEISGCGKWIRPLKANPEYKGKWSAPLIPNPAYKGEWTPRKIKNPDYFEDLKPANFEPLGAIGFEIWTMQNNILFDNIYVGHSVADADRLASETFAVKIRGEKAAEDVDKAKEPPKMTSPSDINFWKEPVSWVREHFQLFYEIAQYDLPQAIKFVPQIAAGLAVVVLTGIGLIVSLVAALIPRSVMKEVPAKASAKAKDASAKVGEVKPKVAEVLAKVQRDDAAAATGAEAKAGVSKRVAKSLQE